MEIIKIKVIKVTIMKMKWKVIMRVIVKMIVMVIIRVKIVYIDVLMRLVSIRGGSLIELDYPCQVLGESNNN